VWPVGEERNDRAHGPDLSAGGSDAPRGDTYGSLERSGAQRSTPSRVPARTASPLPNSVVPHPALRRLAPSARDLQARWRLNGWRGVVASLAGQASTLAADLTWLRVWLYRGVLVAATVLCTAALLWLQNLVGAIPTHPTPLQQIVQWAELIWLAPVPLAIALWLGWFLFADLALPDPAPVAPPGSLPRPGEQSTPVRLVFRVVTRGDNQDVLRDSIVAIHTAFAYYPGWTGPYRIEVVTERPVDLADTTGAVAVYVVPRDFRTAQQSRFKARALSYLQAQVRAQPGDWFIYLDEESAVDTSLVAGLYRFVWRAQSDAWRKGQPSPRLIGQGAILYQNGTWFFRGADALRTADDLGRFRLQYALGMPVFGVHGSFIVVSGEDDANLSFDVGERNSLTEDAAWALRAWARGYRFGWVEGYLREQPPQRMGDFVRQRARWLSGIRLVLRDEQTPLRYRACLGVFTLLWQLSFLPFLVTVAALLVHIAPPVWMRLPADFAWATFVLAYVQGAHAQASRPASAIESSEAVGAPPGPFAQRLRGAGWCVLSWVMALCYIWYALLEAAGVLYSLKPKKDFFVIYKPSLAKRGADESASEAPDLPASSASLVRRPQV
jgi:egghead protein (zeste-white 4 protein)